MTGVAAPTGAWAVAIPMAIYTVAIGVLHGWREPGRAVATVVMAATAILVAALLSSIVGPGLAVLAIGVIATGFVALDVAVAASRRGVVERPLPAVHER